MPAATETQEILIQALPSPRPDCSHSGAASVARAFWHTAIIRVLAASKMSGESTTGVGTTGDIGLEIVLGRCCRRGGVQPIIPRQIGGGTAGVGDSAPALPDVYPA